MSSKLSEQLKVIQIDALQNITGAATTTGTGVAAGLSVHRAMGIVDITSVAGGADDTYTLTIQGSNTAIDSGFESAHADGEAATLAFTQPNAVSASPVKVGLKPFKWYRSVWVTADGTADMNVITNIALQPSKLPAAAQAAS